MLEGVGQKISKGARKWQNCKMGFKESKSKNIFFVFWIYKVFWENAI